MWDYTDDYLPPSQPATAKRILVRLALFVLGLAAAAMVVTAGYYWHLASGFEIREAGQMPERSQVLDRHGNLIGRLHGANRVVVSLDAVSPLFLDALIAREDSRFFHHHGVDVWGVLRAVLRNLKDQRMTQGASTLTMQLARVSFGIEEKSLHRKLLEAVLALRIEQTFSKKEILSFYVNRVYLGSGIYGVERAAQAYFGKPAKDLGLGEGAMLAGIIRAPNRFSPFRHYQEAVAERDTVVGRMLALGFISEQEAQAAQSEKLAIRPPSDSAIFQNSYALDAVRRDLNLILEDEDLEDGGLVIRTTLDLELQRAAEAALETQLHEIENRPGFPHPTRARYQEAIRADATLAAAGRPTYLQGSLLALDNRTGGILALVGGRDFEESQYNRALMSQRQIGSLFKPFVYAAAYQNGLLPGTLISDDPIWPSEISWSGLNWSPENSDEQHLGLQPADIGLVKSRNTMSVRVGERAGFAQVKQLALKAGFHPPAADSPQLYIGNLGADLKTVTSAFSSFARDGYKTRPFLIESITDAQGNVMYQNAQIGFQLLPPPVAWLTNQAMEKVLQPGGTASQARTAYGFQGPGGGKTGTTNDYKDAWFVGYSAPVTCGVWIGLDDPQTIMHKGYGGTLALPIWAEIMRFAETHGYAAVDFRTSVSVTTVELCQVTGCLANWACHQENRSYTATIPYEMIPRTGCEIHGQFQVARRPIRPRPIESMEGDGIFDRLRRLFW